MGDEGVSDVVVGNDGVSRCWWSSGDDLYEGYHDLEWGRPVDDDVRLFEKLSLEGFQSGLSWLTILRKRDNFRRAFKSFDIESIARFNARSVGTPSHVRNTSIGPPCRANRRARSPSP